MLAHLAVLALIVLIYSVLSGAIERTPFGGPLLWTAAGLALGVTGFGVLDFTLDPEGVGLMAELTLALVLFIDAANVDFAELKRSRAMPRRLLLIGLPLTIVLGILFGTALLGQLALLEIALLATLLAPTDAALGKSVVSDERIPNGIRTSLNVESGLNDGICVPIFLAFLATATQAAAEDSFAMLTLGLLVEEIGIGAAVGVVLVAIAVPIIRLADSRGWITESWQQLPVPALAVACFAAAQSIGGSGFIACFVGGLLLNLMARQHLHRWVIAGEAAGDTLSLLTWVVFGAVVVGDIVHELTWQIVLYAVLSLTIIRMLPVYLAFRGSEKGLSEVLFMGWFGPRGLASIVFTVMMLEAHLPEARTIALTAACTIILSVVAHGISAKPLTALLVRRLGPGGAEVER
jgi:NhaP-type Na+/H+ or K+/H+ antiporter